MALLRSLRSGASSEAPGALWALSLLNALGNFWGTVNGSGADSAALGMSLPPVGSSKAVAEGMSFASRSTEGDVSGSARDPSVWDGTVRDGMVRSGSLLDLAGGVAGLASFGCIHGPSTGGRMVSIIDSLSF